MVGKRGSFVDSTVAQSLVITSQLTFDLCAVQRVT